MTDKNNDYLKSSALLTLALFFEKELVEYAVRKEIVPLDKEINIRKIKCDKNIIGRNNKISREIKEITKGNDMIRFLDETRLTEPMLENYNKTIQDITRLERELLISIAFIEPNKNLLHIVKELKQKHKIKQYYENIMAGISNISTKVVYSVQFKSKE